MHDLENDRTDVVLGWSTFLKKTILNNSNFVFAQPKQCVAWIDVFCIPKNAKNYENALKFIEFITREENITLIQESCYGNQEYQSGMNCKDLSLKQIHTLYRFWQWFKDYEVNKKEAIKALDRAMKADIDECALT